MATKKSFNKRGIIITILATKLLKSIVKQIHTSLFILYYTRISERLLNVQSINYYIIILNNRNMITNQQQSD